MHLLMASNYFVGVITLYVLTDFIIIQQVHFHVKAINDKSYLSIIFFCSITVLVCVLDMIVICRSFH